MMSKFGKDKNVTCLLVSLDGVEEEHAIFDELLAVDDNRQSWHAKKFPANPQRTHILVVLCRTLTVQSKVKALTQISADVIKQRKKQAKDAGFTSFSTAVEDEFSMIFY